MSFLFQCVRLAKDIRAINRDSGFAPKSLFFNRGDRLKKNKTRQNKHVHTHTKMIRHSQIIVRFKKKMKKMHLENKKAIFDSVARNAKVET